MWQLISDINSEASGHTEITPEVIERFQNHDKTMVRQIAEWAFGIDNRTMIPDAAKSDPLVAARALKQKHRDLGSRLLNFGTKDLLWSVISFLHEVWPPRQVHVLKQFSVSFSLQQSIECELASA